jgi:predicted lipid-binding transport protein (Tim44 family)
VARLATLTVLALALAACGGGDDAEDARQAVRDFVEATNERDGDELCGELLTQEYLEKYTGATGENAQEACTQQLDVISGLKLRLVKIDGVQVDGDEATVRATIATGGQRTGRRFGLVKEDGDWKLDSGS